MSSGLRNQTRKSRKEWLSERGFENRALIRKRKRTRRETDGGSIRGIKAWLLWQKTTVRNMKQLKDQYQRMKGSWTTQSTGTIDGRGQDGLCNTKLHQNQLP